MFTFPNNLLVFLNIYALVYRLANINIKSHTLAINSKQGFDTLFQHLPHVNFCCCQILGEKLVILRVESTAIFLKAQSLFILILCFNHLYNFSIISPSKIIIIA